MDKIKESFCKVKEDFSYLSNEVNVLRSEISQLRMELINVCEIIANLSEKITEKGEKLTPTQQIPIQTIPTHIPTHQQPLNVLKDQNKPFSTGNEGVPTDRQTDQQTDKSSTSNSKFTPLFPMKSLYNSLENTEKPVKTLNFTNFNQNSLKTPLFHENPIDHAAKILDSLDGIKKEIRLKFKRLTPQEMLVFSALYNLEEESAPVDYKAIASNLELTESSIRDYIGKLIKKGIPVEKKRINNKTIALSVSSNLKRIASLSTILQLRDL